MIDEYCAEYREILKEARNYECFKYLHIGIMSPIKRKSLPEIMKVVSINSAQSLHHILANSEWSVKKLKKRRVNYSAASRQSFLFHRQMPLLGRPNRGFTLPPQAATLVPKVEIFDVWLTY